MKRLALLLLALTALLLAAPAAAQPASPSVVVVGVAGLSWDDVSTDRTPTLARLAEEAALGVLSVKAVPAVTCPADGWLTLGAGGRADAFGADAPPCSGSLPVLDGLPFLRERQDEAGQGAVLGALSTALRSAGSCLRPLGEGARLAAAAGGRSVVAADCELLLVDAGSTADLAEADRTVARADAARSAGATLLVVGVSVALGEDEPGLQLALADGRGFPPGALVSASTRRAPYVQLVDVAPTVLDVLGLSQPPEMTGQPWRSVGEAPGLAELRDLQLRAAAADDATVPFFVVLAAALLVLLAVAVLLRRPRVVEVVGLGATAALGASYLANLVPWWRAGLPLLALLAVVLVLSAAVVTASLLLPPIFVSLPSAKRGARRRGEDRRQQAGPAGAVCGFVAAVLCLDLLTGAALQIDAVAGYSPLVAGRFAGIGNVAFGVLAASALLATAACTERLPPRAAALLVGTVAVVVVAVDGAPPWGSDVGGVLALVPAFALLGMLRSGVRVTPGRLLLAGLAGAAVVAAFALADYARAPADRTHLGRFAQDVLDGTAGTLLRRKAEAVLGLLFSSPVTALLPLVVAAAVYLVVRPPPPLRRAFVAAPAWRHGLLAVGLASAVGFAVNDSGAAVPALAVMVAGPATVAVVARVSAVLGAAER